MQLPEDKYEAAKLINQQYKDNTLHGSLDIEIVEASPEKMVGTMQVNSKNHQPFGLLHGGANVALAESLASLGAWLNLPDRTTHVAVGQEINANHLRPIGDGMVTGEATPLHRGRSSQVWDIKIYDEKRRLVCVSRCTVAITEIKQKPITSEKAG
ncbi:hotdog fold thioesterase [Candidatus Chlorohelix sp.]|uniref:hotdog fold thioesterase n=1 Tax=Candidatus Chlorohelix sp. TaxID=3139201 RepID=UPI0030322982